jgi:hypothetical protein
MNDKNDIQVLAEELSPQNVPPGGVITLNAGSVVNTPFKHALGTAAQKVNFTGPDMYAKMLKFLDNYRLKNGKLESLKAKVAYPNNEQEAEKTRKRLRRINLVVIEDQVQRNNPASEKNTKPGIEPEVSIGPHPFGVVTGLLEALNNMRSSPGQVSRTANPDDSRVAPRSSSWPPKPRPGGSITGS